MTSIEQKLDEIEKKLDEIKAEIKSNSKTGDKPFVLRPNKDTPVNTIISFEDSDELFFFKKAHNDFVEYSTAYNPKTHFQATINDCIINVEEDLRFRLFLNAPEGYDWGAVDSNGSGYVYEEEPDLEDAEMWNYDGDGRFVGSFPQYKDIWKETLVRRKK